MTISSFSYTFIFVLVSNFVVAVASSSVSLGRRAPRVDNGKSVVSLFPGYTVVSQQLYSTPGSPQDLLEEMVVQMGRIRRVSKVSPPRPLRWKVYKTPYARLYTGNVFKVNFNSFYVMVGPDHPVSGREDCFFRPGALVREGDPAPVWNFIEDESKTRQLLRRGLGPSSSDPVDAQLELVSIGKFIRMKPLISSETRSHRICRANFSTSQHHNFT